MYDWPSLYYDLGKLLLAAILGGAIGFERETHGQAAGFRTYLIVSIGACLMMMLSLHMEKIYHDFDMNKSVVRIDPGRIASYAIASMGFLGAGAIIKGRGSVRGLTTAAGLWVATGIGLSIGAGYIYQTLVTTFIILLNLYWLHPLRGLMTHRVYSILSLRFKNTPDKLDRIKQALSEFPTVKIQSVNYKQNISARSITYRIRLHYTDENVWPMVVKSVLEIEGIETVEWSESDVP
ncbi:MAG: MgtC/SapB family protein [Nitrospirae bacterium]|nr:MgtC/SapB family protein [Nitrospirota bacterium]